MSWQSRSIIPYLKRSSRAIRIRIKKSQNKRWWWENILIVKAFEDTFFHFQDFTFRTAPGIRYLLPGGPRRNTVLGISFPVIVNIVALETDPSRWFMFLRHSKSTPVGWLSWLVSYFLYLFEITPHGKKDATNVSWICIGCWDTRGYFVHRYVQPSKVPVSLLPV